MISIVLDLEMFDEIKVILDSGRLYDSLNHYTHFSGYLLEQDQVAFSTYRESDFETKNDEMYVDHCRVSRVWKKHGKKSLKKHREVIHLNFRLKKEKGENDKSECKECGKNMHRDSIKRHMRNVHKKTNKDKDTF